MSDSNGAPPRKAIRSMPIGATGPRLWWVAVVCGMASYVDAATITGFGGALVIYQHSAGITGTEIGILSFVLTIFIALGAATGGRLGDRFGRKPIFSVTMVAIVIAMALFTFASSFPLLLIAAVLSGYATGADLPVSIATIAEAASDSNRGKLIGLSQVLWMIGALVEIALQAAMGNEGQVAGQIMFAQIGVAALLVLLGRLSLPESSVWLEARDERVRGIHTERAERASFFDLFRAPYRGPLLSLIAFYSLVNLAANTGGQFQTYLWVNVVGATPQYAGQVGLVQWGIALVFAIVFLKIVDTKWRMPAFYVGAAAGVLATFFGTFFGMNMATLWAWGLGGTIASTWAFEAILKVWTQESFPTLVRSSAQGLILGVGRGAAALLALVTPALAAVGPQVLFGLLTAMVAIGMTAAIVRFRKGNRNEFDLENQMVAPGKPARIDVN